VPCQSKTLTMENRLILNKVLTEITINWPRTSGGDPNTIDVLVYARIVVEIASVELPLDLPEKEAGRRIVEVVEKEFISSDLIRQRSLTELARRSRRVIDELEKESFLSFGGVAALVAALFTWHGCVCMAKSLRPTHVTLTGESPYSLELRKQGYAMIEEQWRKAELQGNLWIRYGVSVARRFALARGDSIFEDWVPKDSPYWD